MTGAHDLIHLLPQLPKLRRILQSSRWDDFVAFLGEARRQYALALRKGLKAIQRKIATSFRRARQLGYEGTREEWKTLLAAGHPLPPAGSISPPRTRFVE